MPTHSRETLKISSRADESAAMIDQKEKRAAQLRTERPALRENQVDKELVAGYRLSLLLRDRFCGGNRVQTD